MFEKEKPRRGIISRFASQSSLLSLSPATLLPSQKDGGPPESFDTFLCYNSEDKNAVKRIGLHLRKNGLKPWLDEWELRPGVSWQRVLEGQIARIHSVSVFVGESGVGPWQRLEVEAFLREFVRRGCPIIPVILASRHLLEPVDLPVFLRGLMWVDFRRKSPSPMSQLIWGITGKPWKPGNSNGLGTRKLET